MSKKFNNCVHLCASLIIGFTSISFAAEPNASLMNIPPPPSLQNPVSEIKSAAYGSVNSLNATVGTNKDASLVAASTAATMPKSSNANASLFSNKGKGMNTTRSAVNKNSNANAVNAAARETEKKEDFQPLSPTTTTWTFQQMPAANTMYTTPLRK